MSQEKEQVHVNTNPNVTFLPCLNALRRLNFRLQLSDLKASAQMAPNCQIINFTSDSSDWIRELLLGPADKIGKLNRALPSTVLSVLPSLRIPRCLEDRDKVLQSGCTAAVCGL